jgi:hypothetical protein
MYQYEIASGKDILPLVKLARKHRLFVPGWTMSYTFKQWNANPKRIQPMYQMVLAYYDSLPIGVATYTSDNNHAMVFVRKKHRRNKVGTTMMKMISAKVNTFDYEYGNRASLFFWNAMLGEKNTMDNMPYVLDVHPVNDSIMVLQTGDDVWIGENVNGQYEYRAGYWPANSTGVAQATDILNNINV